MIYLDFVREIGYEPHICGQVPDMPFWGGEVPNLWLAESHKFTVARQVYNIAQAVQWCINHTDGQVFMETKGVPINRVVGGHRIQIYIPEKM